MVHPVTGETISSYVKLMHNPATAEIWQTAFGKDFEGIAQGNNKMGKKSINAMFVMTHEEIQQVLQAGKNSLMPTQWWNINRKRRMRIGFGSQLGAI
jgi:hypothetical protein